MASRHVTVRNNGLGIAERYRRRAVLGDVFVKVNQVILRLGREDDGVGLQALSGACP